MEKYVETFQPIFNYKNSVKEYMIYNIKFKIHPS